MSQSSQVMPVSSVCLENVSKSFAHINALHQVNATIFSGRLTGLVGPDGAGKTTLMRLMAGLLQPSSGRVTVLGRDTVSQQSEIALLTGYMPQRFGLYEDLSVMENMCLYADLRLLPSEKRHKIFDRLLDFTRLGPFAKRLAGQLSGGMKQKLGLACALMAQPAVLLLDEPGVGVDPVSRLDLSRMVDALTGDGMTVIWATSYLEEAEKCELVLLLNEGCLEFYGPPGELTSRLHSRTYKILEALGDRRVLLSSILELPAVSDGAIQGGSIRIVLHTDTDIKVVSNYIAPLNLSVVPVEPRFEDAFIDLLGGRISVTSMIADQMEPIILQNDITVSCSHLTRCFGRFTATDDVSFDVKKGEIFGLLGPNGAGKSTTFKMLCGLLKPTSGTAHVVGLDLARATSHAKNKLGYMAQQFSLYGLLSVHQNLEFSAGVYGLTGALKRLRIEEMIHAFQLQSFLNSAPNELSLGYKQRLSLACSLMHHPPVLFLDEPTSGVDPITRREFWTHINGLVRKGVTVMVTTHFMDEAEYCDRVGLIYHSKLIALDTPDNLKRQVIKDNDHEPTMEDVFIELIKKADLKERVL